MWNASILAADLISSGEFDVHEASVLELGAGAGLAGIVAALNGATVVLLSDYNSPRILQNLLRNADANLPPAIRNKVSVTGHVWGESVASISR